MKSIENFQIGTRFQFLTGNDKGKVFVITSNLQPCARTEGCYNAKYEDSGVEVSIFPSELKKHGYAILNAFEPLKTEQLMKNKGFSLNVYGEDAVWEFCATEGKLNEKLCEIFGVDAEPEKVILQCREDFTNCIFYYDLNVVDIDTDDFLSCVEKMDDVLECDKQEDELTR